MPRSCDDPDGTLDTRHGVSSGTGFSILLVDLLPHLNNYGAISTFRRLRAALWPVWFPVYASTVLFPHPSAITASGFMLFTRCLPRSSNGLANTTATLGSYYWLGIITSGLTPDKKRLAWLGAQQGVQSHPEKNIRMIPSRRKWKAPPEPLVLNWIRSCYESLFFWIPGKSGWRKDSDTRPVPPVIGNKPSENSDAPFPRGKCISGNSEGLFPTGKCPSEFPDALFPTGKYLSENSEPLFPTGKPVSGFSDAHIPAGERVY